MNLLRLMLLAGLLLSACATASPLVANRQGIYDAAMKAVAAHGETWSHHAAGGEARQDARDGTWTIIVGKVDPAHTPLDVPDPAFFPGTVRKLRFSRDGILLTYKRSSQR